MEGSKGQKYFNFPIVLLQGFLIDHKKCLNDIGGYALYDFCVKNYNSNITLAAKFFDVNLDNEDNTFGYGKALFEKTPEGLPKVGISKDIYFDFYNNEKSEFKKVTLLAFLAIKSVLQNKAYWNLYNDFLIARMDGKSQPIKDVNELSPELRKYNKEYQFKKIKDELILNWGLKHYGKSRGFYVSFKMTLEDLIFQVEKNKKSNKMREQKEKEKAAILAAMERLNKEK